VLTVLFRLCGFPPFYDDNNGVMAKAIEQGDYEFPSPYWDKISDLAKDFIRCILVVNPEERPDAEMILTHPWLSSNP
jgi:calcium/calmodulin-dependent protein kinase I